MKRTGIILLFLFCCFFTLWRLDKPYLWNDEGDTVFLGRAIGSYGVPKATDGRNANSFFNCLQLDQNFNSRRVPWVQYYVAFASEKIFGESTAGARTLFALLGVLTFWPIGLLLRRYSFAWIAAAVVVLLPQTIMFNRNARYFSLINLETALLLWLVLGVDDSRKKKTAVASLSILLFFTHPLVAILTLASLSAYYLLRSRQNLMKKLLALWVGLPLWTLWYRSSEGFLDRFSGTILITKIFTATSFWIQTVFQNFLLSLSDFDFIGSFSLVGWILLGAACVQIKRRKGKLDSIPLTLLILSLFTVVGVGAVSMPERLDGERLSALRYMPSISMLLPLILFFIVWEFKIKTVFKSLILFALLFSNLFSSGFWMRNSPLSWWIPVYAEILFEGPDQIKRAVATVRGLNLPKDTLIEVIPPSIEPNMIIYLGDHFLIKPYFHHMPPDCRVALENALGESQFSKLQRPPHLTLKMPDKVFAQFLEPNSQKVLEKTLIPMQTPHFDGSRPELTRHDFADNKIEFGSDIEVVLYEK